MQKLLLTIQGAVLTEEQKEKLLSYTNDCIASSGVKKELVLNAREKAEFVEDANLEKYYFCILKKLKFVNDAGEIQVETVRSKIPENADKTKAEAIIEKCKTQKGCCPEKTAYLLVKCFRQNVSNDKFIYV